MPFSAVLAVEPRIRRGRGPELDVANPLNWVEVSAEALRRNLAAFRQRVGPQTKLGAVVKSNAYGHGMLPVAGIATRAGADWLCVDSLEEALALREAGFRQPVLIMGYVSLAGLEAVVEHDLQLVVYREQTLTLLARLAAAQQKTVRVHLKVETGTYRQGVPEAQVPQRVQQILQASHLELEGLSTHLANVEDTTDHSFAESQVRRFEVLRAQVSALSSRPVMSHVACSAAALLFSRTHLDMVRLGISMYGLWPSKETRVSCRDRGKPVVDLQPALQWKTRIAQIKSAPEGSFIGYGCTYRTTRESRVAVLPVGYYEGYDRRLSGVAHVLVHGKRAPVRGRVCMNMCMIDVTDIPNAQEEDEVVLIGSQHDEQVTAEQLASWCGTIPYEIIARIHPALPRIIRQDRSA